MKIVKIVSFLLAGVMLTSAAGCSKEKETSADIKTARVWMNVGHSKQFWEGKVNEFNQTRGKELGIKIDCETKTDAGYEQALEVAIQSNQLPEFFIGGELKKLVENDRIVALDDLPGLEKLIESRKPYMREISHMLDGKTYSVPSAMTTRGLIYNKDMFKEAGLVDENGEPTPPKTFDELREYAKRLTDKKKGTYGIVLPLKWTSWVSSDIEGLAPASFGRGAYNAADGTYDYTVMKPIIETFLGIRDDESFYPGAEGLDNDPARARFAEGSIGMKLSYSFDVGVFNEQFPASMDWGVAPLPVYDLNKTYHQPATMDIGLKISKGAVDLLGEETAAEIYNWFYSDEMIKQLYAEGLEIPYSWDLVKDVEMKEEKKGWTEFCQMAEISAVTPLTMPKTKTDSFAELILNDIWTGNVTDIDKALKDYSDKVNNAVAEYKGTYPDIDYSIYINPEWNGELER